MRTLSAVVDFRCWLTVAPLRVVRAKGSKVTGGMQPAEWSQQKTMRKLVEVSGWKPDSDFIRSVYLKKQEATESILRSPDSEGLYK